ncbi:cytochrome P450/oxidoreductase [Cryptosporangium aurantiacum]|uniref:cytochrome P450/oxidoreductase n=1 Tax=Cryptosporangium aurantiacum TaxID=134849 RepID=UPI0009344A9B|nr:cytochrome P450 [Cryptosporangium aurantiacum]
MVEFDHHAPEFTIDPVRQYAELRDKSPVAWTESYGGHWVTTRYDDITRIARDDATFSSARNDIDGIAFVIPESKALPQYPIELDPPQSTPYRELINPLLSRSAVEALVPMIAKHVTEVIDAFIEDGSADLVHQLTNPVPTAVTLDWLGFPREDWKRLAGPIHDLFAAIPGSEREQRGGAALGFMGDRIFQLMHDRREDPKDDAISWLVAHGKAFSDDELASVIFLLVAGGVDTTTSLTGSTLVHLANHPEDRARLIREPALLDVATEEFLRKFAPSQSMARTVMTDTTIGGCPVAHGERVLIPWIAANHDPEVFPDPDRVILDRDPRGHLSFGIGSHRCAGAHLARAMFREMITQVLERFPDYRLTEPATPTESWGNQSGWDAIPVTFTPGRKRGTPAPKTTTGLDVQVLTLDAVTPIADGVVSLRLVGDGELPSWEPGAHLDLILPSGKVRQYSLTGDPADRESYQVAVLREPAGRGGSAEVHEVLTPGATLRVRGPKNHFPLVDAERYLFVAGGIGITPISAMVRAADARGADWTLLYGGRTRASMAFASALHEQYGDRVRLVPQDEFGHPDLAGTFAAAPEGTKVYCCGPEGLLTAVENTVGDLELHVERFTGGGADRVAPIPADARAFEVTLVRAGHTLRVPANRTLLEAIRDVVPGVPYDCEEGYCGSCETRVLAGAAEHRDSILSEAERAGGSTMMICVSRCATDRLSLDL